MAYVRGTHIVAPVIPSLSNYQATQIRRPLLNPQAIPHIIIHHRRPMNIRKPVPQHMPILQPPTLPREYNFYEDEEEEEEQYQEEIFNYPTVVVADQHRIITQQLMHRTPNFIPLKTYTKQSLAQRNRHAKSKYPPNIYYRH